MKDEIAYTKNKTIFVGMSDMIFQQSSVLIPLGILPLCAFKMFNSAYSRVRIPIITNESVNPVNPVTPKPSNALKKTPAKVKNLAKDKTVSGTIIGKGESTPTAKHDKTVDIQTIKCNKRHCQRNFQYLASSQYAPNTLPNTEKIRINSKK